MTSLPHLRSLLATSVLLGASVCASAAPFWTGYRGTIANSSIPAIVNGESYTVNLIFDNGGGSANDQTWTGAQLTCVVWYMNNDNRVMFVQDLTKANTNFLSAGQISTDAAGDMTSMLSMAGHGMGGAGAGSFVGQGLSGLLTEVYAGVPTTGLPPAVFIAGPPGQYTDSFSDSNSKIPVTPNAWKPVAPFTGWGIQKNLRFADLAGCADPAPVVTPPTPTGAQPVPSLDTPALALLGLAAAALGGRYLRRRKR